MTRQSPARSWPQLEATDLESAQRDDLVQLGVWMFLATVVMLFAAFTSAYIVRRSASDWTPIAWPGILWVNTGILVISSAALERARRASAQGKTAAQYGILAAVGFGLLFLAGQITVWRELVAHGVYLPTSPHSSFFYVLTGVHAVHVAAGLVLLSYTATRMWPPSQKRYGEPRRSSKSEVWNVSAISDREARARLIAASTTFWHFLAALWLYVFLLVTVF